jgi:hypothetical protein
LVVQEGIKLILGYTEEETSSFKAREGFSIELSIVILSGVLLTPAIAFYGASSW